MLDVGCWVFSFSSWVQCANFSGNSLSTREPAQRFGQDPAGNFTLYLAQIFNDALGSLNARGPKTVEGRLRPPLRNILTLPPATKDTLKSRHRTSQPCLVSTLQGVAAAASLVAVSRCSP